MSEQTLEVTTNGKGYKTINLKNKYGVENNKKIIKVQGIDPDNYAIVTKKYLDGFEVDGKFGKSYSCKVEYAGEEVSFWLNAKEHEVYSTLGGVDDRIKISCKKETFLNKSGLEVTYDKLFFEKVEE